MSTPIDKYWQRFLATTKRPPETPYLESFYFGHTKSIANDLLALVLAGTKTATCSSALAYAVSEEAAPQVGDLSIVTDWDGHPYCVIETRAITQLTFSEMTYAICRREGEDDTLLSWQKNHETFFKVEGKELGYEFSQAMPVIFEDFKVVYR